jgi:hypothetical protein
MHISTPLLALLPLTSALGINCKGNGNCGLPDGVPHVSDIIAAAANAGDNHVFQNGEHVACRAFGGAAGGSLCAFPQGTNGGIEGWKAKQLLGFIRDHGCSRCGSVPVNFPNDNDVGCAGQLTVNWVS